MTCTRGRLARFSKWTIFPPSRVMRGVIGLKKRPTPLIAKLQSPMPLIAELQVQRLRLPSSEVQRPPHVLDAKCAIIQRLTTNRNYCLKTQADHRPNQPNNDTVHRSNACPPLRRLASPFYRLHYGPTLPGDRRCYPTEV
jgi:hypothetical protein